MAWLKRHENVVAAAVIMIVVVAGWLFMPRIMRAASGAGPVAGLAIAGVFILAFFGVLWLRARHQRRFDRD